MKNDRSIPVLVGHPFAPIGRGEDIRASFRAFQIARFTLPVRDIFALNDPDVDIERELTGHLIKELSESINIFFINGDEIANVLQRLRDKLPSGAYNIVYPAWELSIYPREWADQIECFDEVWAQSRFVYESLRQAVSKPVFRMALASQVEVSTFLSRRYFGITESSYVFLFFFDFTSYIDRKNPFAVLRAFEKVCAEKPGEDVRLVIKMGGSVYKQEDYRRFMEQLEEFKYRYKVIVVNRTLSNNEIKNLVRCCDCFVSLHRSEGFGRGMAEAMCLGKPVIATGYSGNLDFMNQEKSCLVRYKLVPVMEGQYPHARGQVWAEPDIDHAAEYMLKLLSDRDFGRRLGAVASRHMRQFFSYRAIGLQYRKRVEEILQNKVCPTRPSEAVETEWVAPVITHRRIRLPDFLIVGAARSGTTSLYHYLKQHPQIFMSENKEPRFFAYENNPEFFYPETPVKTFDEYTRLFEPAGKDQAAGESSVAYLYFYKKTIRNIKRHVPAWQNLKIIIMLRDPTERAFSHFALGRLLGVESEELTDLGFMRSEGKEFYIKVGMYYEKVKAYMENFDYVEVYLYDDLKADALRVVKDIFLFIGVDYSFQPDVSTRHNPTKKPKMKKETREHLKDVLREDILKLQELIGRDLSAWLR